MRLLRHIFYALRMWFELKDEGYTFVDCWEIVSDILDEQEREH